VSILVRRPASGLQKPVLVAIVDPSAGISRQESTWLSRAGSGVWNASFQRPFILTSAAR
jgi:hypothetical protein